jgi:hypothetical protein
MLYRELGLRGAQSHCVHVQIRRYHSTTPNPISLVSAVTVTGWTVWTASLSGSLFNTVMDPGQWSLSWVTVLGFDKPPIIRGLKPWWSLSRF